MKKILIVFAHPAFNRSCINSALRKAVENLENITFHDLYSSYPNFLIDVDHEQRLCEAHDVIIFQHPFYWYSTPAIMKEWLDLVLQHGWAYGSKGNALSGKLFLNVLSAGDQATYLKKGDNPFSLKHLLSPFCATAKLCKMTWLPPFAVLAAHSGMPQQEINSHAEDYRRFIIALRDDRINLGKAVKSSHINSDLNGVLKG
ncbi:NAD(P)H-dependent oxidoreductase [Desulfosediminicola sp.]|uniref:NAD(P)H-dependent oxidoreductase n=1 Tax=Desulfosediminicola sp. TaxID=2886825 RepID=UPI003AF286E1